MAEYKKEKLQDTDKSGFGKYGESTGGGASPNPQKPGTHGHGVNSDYRQANNDTNQPRTDDGKFTYKSVNGKSIDPKYGPSRGTTVNPLLTGGVNGIQIDDVEEQFFNKKGAIWEKYKDKWYHKGSEYTLMSQGKHHKAGFSTRVSAMAIWEVGRLIYNEKLGEFGGNIEFEHKLGNGKTKKGAGYGGISEGKELFAEGKKGARNAEESQAFQKAQASGKEQAVIDAASGGIKLKPGVVLTAPQPKPTPTPTKPRSVTPSQTTIGGTQPQQGVTLSQNTNPNFRKKAPASAPSAPLNHSVAQIQTLRKALLNNGADPTLVNSKSDAELDAMWDLLVSQ